jgi:leucyl-tRNA synthetase
MSDPAMATTPTTEQYLPATIEPRWQEAWREADSFLTPPLEDERAPAYIFAACPFTSGKMHMGHVRSYSISDAYARFLRARGHAVLFSIGFDAFGLPAELEAIRQEMAPADWVALCAEQMTEQFKRLGLSFDWSRRWFTSEPDMYQWSQRLFLMLLDDELVYYADGQVDWCDSCRTVLAGMQVEDGCCWRCHGPVRQVQKPQWYLRSSVYREENEQRLQELTGWNDLALAAQRAVLGRVDGVEMEVSSLEGQALTVFTPHGEAIDQAQFVTISPRHPDIAEWIDAEDLRRGQEGVRSSGVQRAERSAETVPLIPTGRVVTGVDLPGPLPVFVSPSVEARFGPTAVLGIPAVDQTDAALAARMPAQAPTGMKLTARGASSRRPASRYRLRDFAVSRQRVWGAPIPLIHCDTCGTVPVPEEDLPVRLPDGLRVSGSGNALAESPEFLAATCPQCGRPARRETDTLDCHFDGLWQWMPFMVPREDRAHSLFEHPELKRWLPVDQVIWGVDGGGSMFDQRSTAKVLRDRGLLAELSNGEPHRGVTMHEMIHVDGRKMSKHLFNSIDPDEFVEKLGADSVRLAVLFAAAPSNDLMWTDQALSYCHRWLGSLWRFARPRLAALAEQEIEPQLLDSDKQHRRLSAWCSTAVERMTENLEKLDMHRAARNVMKLLERIESFEEKALARGDSLSTEERAAIGASLLVLLRLLNPLAPHISEELWSLAGQEPILALAEWPQP